MTVTTTEALPGSSADAPGEDDPFGLDITFI